MLRFLLDTNVLAEPLRPRPNERILELLQEHQQVSAIAAPAWHEMVFGCWRLKKSRKRDAIESYLLETIAVSFAILPYDAAAAKWHGRERARLETTGRTPPYVDSQIAAIAATRGLTLVTANVRDFRTFRGLELTSWLEGATPAD